MGYKCLQTDTTRSWIIENIKSSNLSSSPQSFGMKMNNQSAAQKDISFGGSFCDWIKDTATLTYIARCKKMRDADIPLYNISPFGMADEANVKYAEATCLAKELRKGEWILNNLVSGISLPIAVSTSADSVDLVLNGMSSVNKRFKEDNLF